VVDPFTVMVQVQLVVLTPLTVLVVHFCDLVTEPDELCESVSLDVLVQCCEVAVVVQVCAYSGAVVRTKALAANSKYLAFMKSLLPQARTAVDAMRQRPFARYWHWNAKSAESTLGRGEA
jgi:hypothetical protein